MEKLKDDVQRKFTDIRNVLNMREKLLLRQADVILQQLGRVVVVAVDPSTTAAAQTSGRDVKFQFEQEEELLEKIRNFGRFHLENINLQDCCNYLKNEDYISPQLDHETMYKNIKQQLQQQPAEENENCNSSSNGINFIDEEQQSATNICVDFSKNKSLIEHNAQYMNESIVNITLQEAKELIKRAKIKREAAPIPPLNLEELDDELESSIAEAVSSLGLGHDPITATTTATSFTNNDDNDVDDEEEDIDDNDAAANSTKETKKKNTTKSRFKPKITINNCNGTINLRNISNLTINCAAEDSISARLPCQMQQQQQHHEQQHSDNEVVSSSSTVQNEQKQQNIPKNNSIPAENSQKINVTCLNERSLAPTATTPTPTPSSSVTTTTTAATSGSTSNNSSNFSSRSQSSKSHKSDGGGSGGGGGGGHKPKQTFYNKKNDVQTSHNCTSTTSINAYPYGIVDYDDDDCDDAISQHAVSCDFYNRLLNEIKKSLRNKGTIENNTHYMSIDKKNQQLETTSTTAPNAPGNEPIANATSSTIASDFNSNMSSSQYYSSQAPTTNASQSGSGAGYGAGRRLVLKNFENLRIVLEANSSDEESSDPKFHPVQIEQWLAEIISETDLEPMQNSDILEHSKIHSDKE